MIDIEMALDVVVSSVRSVAGLYPASQYPIRTQDKLSEQRILTEGMVEAVRVRIIDKLPNLEIPFELNKEYLREITSESKVGEITAAVMTHATEIDLKGADAKELRVRRYSL